MTVEQFKAYISDNTTNNTASYDVYGYCSNKREWSFPNDINSSSSTTVTAVIIDDNTIVRVGDKLIRWGDISKKLEIILEILKEDIEIYELADALTNGREEPIKTI